MLCVKQWPTKDCFNINSYRRHAKILAYLRTHFPVYREWLDGEISTAGIASAVNPLFWVGESIRGESY
jgi:hypothetical protein